MRVVDLHTHSSCSDGTSSPSDVARQVAKRRAALFALTDHDSVEGVEEAGRTAESLGVAFVTGVEISAREHDHLHILGYHIDLENPALRAFLEKHRGSRRERVRKCVEALSRAGVPVTFEEVCALAGKTLSRAHIADLLRSKGLASSRQTAFSKFLVPGMPGYVPPQGASFEEAVSVIRGAGGLAVLAHPGAVRDIWDFPRWVSAGLGGLEAYYATHTVTLTRELLDIASRYGLAVTAGSDYHGPKSGRSKNTGIALADEDCELMLRSVAGI